MRRFGAQDLTLKHKADVYDHEPAAHTGLAPLAAFRPASRHLRSWTG